MTEPNRAARIATAGWEVTLLDLGAIHAPLSWVFPHGGEDERAWLPSNGLLCGRGEDAVLVDALATRRALVEELAGSSTIVACSHVDGFGRIERGREGAPVWVDVA